MCTCPGGPLSQTFAEAFLLVDSEDRQWIQRPCSSRSPEQKPNKLTSGDPKWAQKMEELPLRGMTLRCFLQFYQIQLHMVQGWKYAPEERKTRDVVRRVIIPLTSSEECAYAVSSHNKDGPPGREQVMVTHNWGNHFNGLFFFCLVRYPAGWGAWMILDLCRCEHASICQRNPLLTEIQVDQVAASSVQLQLHKNISDPDGRSVKSEINKFDDMMSHLAATGKCRQVIAVDQSLDQLCTPKQKRGEAQIRLSRRQFWLSSKTTCLIVFKQISAFEAKSMNKF